MTRVREPLALENPNRTAISNPPLHASPYSISPFKDALPCTRTLILFGIKNQPMWKKLGFEEVEEKSLGWSLISILVWPATHH